MPRTHKLADLERKFEEIRGIAEEVRPEAARGVGGLSWRGDDAKLANAMARIHAVLDVEVE